MAVKRLVIALDGPAASGKSTIAKRLAARLGFVYVDTGAMYRAVALWALRSNVDLADMHRLEQLAREAEIRFEPGGTQVQLNGEDVSEAIRAPEVSAASSRIAVIPGVRRALVQKQRALGETASVVMEGRDIGTVVFPQADVKVFLDAQPPVRADRRRKELEQQGVLLPEDEMQRSLRERDERDRGRAEAPLMQAPDAAYLDTSLLTLDEVEQAVLKIIRDRTSNGKEFAA